MINNRSINVHFSLQGACTLCGGHTRAALCDGCLADLRRNCPACRRCGLPLPGGDHGEACPACLSEPPPQSRTLTGADYTWPADRLMSRFKDAGRLEAGRALLGPLLAEIARQPERPDLVTEIPSSWHGLRRRGFQQARLVAGWISGATGIPHAPGLLRRARHIRPQRGLSRRARQSNLTAGLDARRRLQGEHVALIDDVITTGSTVAEASRVLLSAGAGQVSVWGLARAPVTAATGEAPP